MLRFHRSSWGTAAIALAAVSAALLVAPHAAQRFAAAERDVPRIAQVADPDAAVRAARRENEPVMVTSLTTATRTVSAQPNGSLTATLSAQPVRMNRGGAWVPIDPTLSVRADGTVAPRAVGAELAFSGGGANKPFATFGGPGRSIALTWPGRLPAPTLEGASATYREVLPEVDLVVRVERDGFVQHLVVKTAKAARNPALRSIRLGLKVDGLRVRSTRSGAVEARDHANTVVFATAPSQMWDATTVRRAPVGVTADATSLTLAPDRKLLTDPAAAFPMVIDPDWRTFGQAGWTKVFSGKPSSRHWNGSDDVDTWAKVGKCGFDDCNGIDTARSYFQFDTAFLGDRRIISATLNATIVYGPSCGARNHQLYKADWGIDGTTSWNNMPTGWLVGTSSAASNYTGCLGNKGIGFNVAGALNTGGLSVYFIKAEDEADVYAWRKYDGGATEIVVNYNTRPDAPYEMSTDPPLAAPCKWCDGEPYVGDDSIRLRGKLSDADNDQLTAVWDIYGGPNKEHHEGPTLGSGNIFSTDLDLRARDGQNVSWTLYGGDGPDGGEWKNGPGPFVVDRVGIGKAPGVTGQLYQEDNRWHGGAGVPGAFTFDAAGVADVDHYLYGWTDPPSVPVDADALGGKATVYAKPLGDGPRDLYVQSVDRAGHRSPTSTMHIYVRAGSGPLAQWSLDDNAQDTAYLGDRNGTVSGGATYAPGAVGSAISLDGSTGYVSAPNAVRTDASFTVSAWAKVTDKTRQQAIVSQDGTTSAGFALWYRPENGGKWGFGMANPDTATKAPDVALSSDAAQSGVWTQLAAVYDAPAKQLRLYVNGVLSATAARTAAPWNATGSLRIGRDQWNANPSADYFRGAIDEVKMYDRILSDGDIRAAVTGTNVQVGYWKFDESSGTTADNSMNGAADATLQGGAKLVGSGAVNGGVQLSAPEDFVSTGAPVLRTDQSFSVAAWVRSDQSPGDKNTRTAVSQDGAVNSGFFLGYRADPAGDKWEFFLPSADTKDQLDSSVVSSGPIARLGEWTHLAAVYDAQAAQIRLYVNGVLAGTAPRIGGFNATGPLLIGRGRWEGSVGNAWIGAVDEVRAYSRAVSEDEIRGIVSRDNVTSGNWKLDGDARDSSTRGLTGTVVNAPAYTNGQSNLPNPADLAVRLDGATTAVSAAHAVDVDRTFSVAVWARLDKAGGQPVVLSEDGSRVSGFKLRVNPQGKWGMVMFKNDVDVDVSNGGWDEVLGGAAQVGQWTHLVGVYDATARQIRLYVNGTLAASAAHTQTWNSTGVLQIGRGKLGGGLVEYFPGLVDDVSVYSRALFPSEIQTMAGRDLSLVHNYTLDESSGTTAADAVGSWPATVAGGAAFGPGRAGNAITLNGATGAVTTTGTDLRTDAGFTVSAWVRLPSKDCDLSVHPACRLDAVTVDGNKTSKFRLGHIADAENPFGAWTFEMPESDVDNALITKAAVSTLPSEVDTWVLLVGVYDPATKKIWLYVNGTRCIDGTLNTPWQAPGGLAIGRGKVNGATTEYWPGSVDDVRLYTGQLDNDRIGTLYHSYPAQTASAR